MTKPIRLAEFARRVPAARGWVADGLAPQIDGVAAQAPPAYRFLRRQWFVAALEAYGGQARTIVVEDGGEARAALPLVRVGPAALRMAAVPGCYWPFRGFPVAQGATPAVFDALANSLAGEVFALRLGPVYDGDPAVEGLMAAARARGWAVLDRFVADSFLLDIAAAQAEGVWPRTSTLKKNRFHEKHLASHGVLDWSFASGPEWTEELFDALACVEAKSWIAARTSGRDAKFTAMGHGAFWRAAARDPVLAQMMWVAVLRIDGRPAAFSFDLNAGTLKYAIANSYDPDVAKHSPGKLLYWRNLVRAGEDGITAVDWGAGDSGYKSVIGAARGPAIRDWLLLRPGLPALAGPLLRHAWRRSGQEENRP